MSSNTTDYIRSNEYDRYSRFLTNSMPQLIPFFITGLFSSTGLFSRPSSPSFNPSRNWTRPTRTLVPFVAQGATRYGMMGMI
jgi:hypothetical protein